MLSSSSLRKVACSATVTLCVGEKSTFTLSGDKEDKGGAVMYYGKNIMPALVSEREDDDNPAEMVVLEGCTHHAAMEKPMEIAKLVKEILLPSKEI